MKIHFHTWGKWSAPFAGYAGDSYQQRRCLSCNKAQIRRIHFTFTCLPLPDESARIAHEPCEVIAKCKLT